MGPNQIHRSRSLDPLHGITLKLLLSRLVQKYGWEELGNRINIKCFTSDPSIASSLKFLRKTAWARQKVERLYLNTEWRFDESQKYSIRLSDQKAKSKELS